MQQQKEIKTCLFCDKTINGRSDKKFCNSYCRVSYNNELISIAKSQMRDVNNALSKNRRILEQLLPEGKQTTKTTQEKLLQKGFLFKYITHINVNKSGQTFYYCYDFGYMPLDRDWYLIVKRNEK